MNIAKVVAKIVASSKINELNGYKFLIINYLDECNNITNKLAVAVDTVQAGIGDVVLSVSSREASLALNPFFVPIDCAIIGIVDSINMR